MTLETNKVYVLLATPGPYMSDVMGVYTTRSKAEADAVRLCLGIYWVIDEYLLDVSQ